ncbi:MAG: putative phage tail protein, partial [Pseudomonas sp.]|uniref:putative phage tail protein n=1 Tax=Pseudomonas sp. TaxID=306 RepID=UPI003D6FB816
VIDAEADALQMAVDRAKTIENAMHPATAGDGIADWERVLGLRPLPSANPTDRVQAVLAKLGELGGLSIPYFVRLAAATGYAITISEPKPWRVGHSSVDEPLYLENVLFVWQVRIDRRPPDATPSTDAALEATFNNLKPAHTFCQFLES